MVIDDELASRRKQYERVFSKPDFDTVFVGTPAELRDNINRPVDGYCVDVFLDSGDWHGRNAASLLSNELLDRPRPAPVFLVSRHWGDPSAMALVSEANRIPDAAVVRYLAWTEFEEVAKKPAAKEPAKQREGALRNKILDDLTTWHGWSTFRPGPDDPIRILTLADMQFGDKNTAPDAIFSEHWIAKALNRDGLIPDLVVLAGDLAFGGSPAEYGLARNRLVDDLLTYMWGANRFDKMRDRLILTPGNHDVNLRFAACDGYGFDLHSGKLKEISGASLSGSKPDSRSDGSWRKLHSDYALDPFRHFARELRGCRQNQTVVVNRRSRMRASASQTQVSETAGRRS
ncbi:metallophosphoesterase family protein [Thiocystis violascens]|nr:metallophosphoesterase [Thiocystis violascens]